MDRNQGKPGSSILTVGQVQPPAGGAYSVKQPLAILGAGGFAREVLSWIPTQLYQVSGFYDEQKEGALFGVPILNDLKKFRYCEFIVAVGDPKARKELFERALEMGMLPVMPIIHPSAIVGLDCSFSRGTIVCPNVTITTNVSMGFNCIVNINATVGHDVRIGDHVTISPGANISGNVVLESLTYVGTNAAIREGKKLEEGSTAGMGCAVVKDVPRGTVVIGGPMRTLEKIS